MKLVNIIVTAVLLSTGFISCQQGDMKKEDLETQKQKQSYGLGIYYGKNMKSQMVEVNDIDNEAFLQGVKDALSKDSLYLLTDADLKVVFDTLGSKIQARQAVKQKEAGTKNKKEGEEFLAKNKNEEGVKTTASGLQYKVLSSGNGPSPKPTDEVTVHYTGTLLNGTEFDSSHKRGQPATFPVTGVIPGWTEALQLMKVGDKWKLFIPGDLAYGENGGGPIPPNSTLIFEVELLSIGKEKAGN